jgi:hypothetical protein
LTIQLNGWWALLLLPAIPVISLAVFATYVLFSLSRIIAPPMSPVQERLAQKYVDTFTEVVGYAQTPKFFIACKIILDVVRRRWRNGYVYRMTAQSTHLKSDFQALAKSYES